MRIAKRDQGIRVAAVRAFAAGAAAIALTLGATAPASAVTVSGCAQSWSEYRGTCVYVDAGQKNSGNHTQYINSVQVVAPRYASSGKLEGWAGNGPTGIAWYATKTGTSATWTVGKWIKSGSGICGAYTYPDGSRSIACITITA